MKALYGKDLGDFGSYDLIFDTGSETIDRIAATVKNTLIAKEARNNESSRKLLMMRAMAARVNAGLLTDPRLCFAATLDASTDKDAIVIRGVVRNSGEYKLVEEAARRLTGGRRLVLELRYRLGR